MPGTAYVILGLVVLLALAVVVYRSLKGPKLPQPNPFDAVTPSREPQFPDGDSASAANLQTPVGAAEQSDAQGTEREEEQAVSEPEEEMKIADYVAQAEQEEKDAEFDSAIDSVQEAINIALAECGADSVDIALLLNKQGHLYQLRDYQEDSDSINCDEYLLALGVLEQRVGPNSEQLLPILQNLISWYYQNGDAQNAETLIRRSDNILDYVRNQSLNGDHADTFRSAGGAEFVYTSPFAVKFTCSDSDAVDSCKEGDEAYAAADYDTAASAFEAAIESVQGEIGRGAAELIPLFRRLGRTLQVKDWADRDDEGHLYSGPADNYQIALGMVVKANGYNAIEAAPLLLDLAAFEDQCGEHYKAEGYLRRYADVLRARVQRMDTGGNVAS